MALTINTNIASLTAQKNLATTQTSLQMSIQRLSSGLRINNASDDAAGLAIASRFTAQINGVNQAVLNSNDGSSLAQTADSALASIADNLQRVRTLAVQSANATNSASDRAALQNEVAQRIAEIDRVATQTQFNGVNLIDGSFNGQQFQVGANAGQTITVSNIASAQSNAMGVTYAATKVSTVSPITAIVGNGDMVINGTTIHASVSDGVSSASSNASAQAIVNAINGSGVQGVTATVSANASHTSANALTADAGGNFNLVSGDLVINGVSILATNVDATTRDTQGTALANAIQANSSLTGVNASYDNVAHKLTLSSVDGRNMTVAISEANVANLHTDVGYAAAGSTMYQGTVTLNSSSLASAAAANIAIVDAGNVGGFGTSTTNAASTGATISALNVSTVTGANAAINSVDSALSSINTTRSQMGAYENRFHSVVANLQSTSTDLSAARSQIQDADFAAETANFTRSQILQQAGTAMLAQANSLPNSVLSLLK
jgi:flagellin